MGTFDAAARVLAGQAPAPAAPFDLAWARFLPLGAPPRSRPAPGPAPEPTHEPTPVVAVDGSHAVLVDNGAAWVVAHRVAAVAWPAASGAPGPGSPRAPRVAPVPVVTATAPADVARHLGDLPGPLPRGADAFAAALRARAEADALLSAIEAAPAGALVLADGALRGLPDEAQSAADAARAAARRRGVALVGVAKRSGLERGGVALAPLLHAAGPPGAWAVPVDDGVWVARLHAGAAQAFRVDADHLADVARLVPLARDAAYLGYPYPLAKAHNAVALTAAEVGELKAGLERALRRTGGGALATARDFHDVLDRNVP